MTQAQDDRPLDGPQPGSFLFWVAASAGVICVAVAMAALLAPRPDTKPNGLVVSLQEPPAKAGSDPHTAQGASHAPVSHGETHDGEAAPPTAPVSDVKSAPAPSSSLLTTDGRIIIDPALHEAGSDGPLTRIAADGRRAARVYAARFDPSESRPRIAIVMTGLGLSATVTQAAIQRLPRGFTLAFSPYGENLQSWVADARQQGHEVLLEVPMEPFDFPENDPGPRALMTGPQAEGNRTRMHWVMSRFSGYAGLISLNSGKFLASEPDVRPFLAEAGARGLFFVDASHSQRSLSAQIAPAVQAPLLRSDLSLDALAGADSIDNALERLVILAQEKRKAVAIVDASPGVIDRIAAWGTSLESRGAVLAPVSALPDLAQGTPTP